MEEELWDIRAKQCLSEIDAFIATLKLSGAIIPQGLVDAIDAFREAVNAKEVK